jgi:hypothetical protein
MATRVRSAWHWSSGSKLVPGAMARVCRERKYVVFDRLLARLAATAPIAGY